MRQRPFNLASVSLMLCVGICLLWVRGRFVSEGVILDGREGVYHVLNAPGGLYLAHLPGAHLQPQDGSVRWYHEPSQPLQTMREAKRFAGIAALQQPNLSALFVPWWVALGVTATPLAWHVSARARRNWRVRHGRCAECGYDLQATPDRCPECGTAAQRPHNPPKQRTATASSGAVE